MQIDSWIGRSSIVATLLCASVALAGCGCVMSVDTTTEDLATSESTEALAARAPSGGAAWSTIAPMNVARRDPTATLLRDGRVLVVGGTSGSSSKTKERSAEIFHPATRTWSPVAPANFPHPSSTATLLEDGRVLVAGDAGPEGTLAVEIYDPTIGTWTGAHLATAARNQHATARLSDGRVLLAGGHDGSAALDRAYLFDPVTKNWVGTGEMNQARSQLTLTLLEDGRVLAAGGATDDGRSAELFDPKAGTWTLTSSMARRRAGHAAARLQGGKVLVVGGGHTDPWSAEIFDPATGAWTAAAPRYFMGSLPRAATLHDGKVLVTSGAHGAELYDPRANTWTLLDNMTLAHGAHAMTLLRCGEALVIGGGSWTSSVNHAELLTGLDDTSCAAAGGAL